MPDWKAHVRPRVAGLRLSVARENEIVDELAQHLDDRWRELIAAGASEDEASRLALVQLRDDILVRNLALLKQSHARIPERLTGEVPGKGERAWFDRLVQDLRYGARMLSRSPGLTFVAVAIHG